MSEADVDPQTEPQRTGLLQDRDFVRFWSGETVSLAGAQVTDFAVLLIAIVTLQASPFEIGLLNVARYTPYLVLSLFAGVWFDRHRRRPVLIASSLTRAALIALIPLASLLGVLSMAWLYVIGFLVGALTVVFDIGSLTYIPGLVDRRHLTEANGKIQSSYSLAAIAGPGLAGLLVGILTAPLALFVNTASYLFSALALSLIRRPEPEPATPAARTSVFASIGEGLRAVVGNRMLRDLATQSATFNLFENAVTTLFAIYAVRQLGLNAGQLGIVIGAGAVGALLGAVLCDRVTRFVGLGRTLRLATLIACTVPLLLLLPRGSGLFALLALAAIWAVNGAHLAIFNVNAVTLRQTITPARLLGRMNASYRLILFGTIPLGALVGGGLAGAFGLHAGLAIALVGLALPTLWLPFSPVFTLTAIPSAPEENVGDPGHVV